MTDNTLKIYYYTTEVTGIVDVGFGRKMDDIDSATIVIDDLAQSTASDWKARQKQKGLLISWSNGTASDELPMWDGRVERIDLSTRNQIKLDCRGTLVWALRTSIDRNFVKNYGTITSVAASYIVTDMSFTASEYNNLGALFTDLTDPTLQETITPYAAGSGPTWVKKFTETVSSTSSAYAVGTWSNVVVADYATATSASVTCYQYYKNYTDFATVNIANTYYLYDDFLFDASSPAGSSDHKAAYVDSVKIYGHTYGTGYAKLKNAEVQFWNYTTSQFDANVGFWSASYTQNEYLITSWKQAYISSSKQMKMRVFAGGEGTSFLFAAQGWLTVTLDYIGVTYTYYDTGEIMDAGMYTISTCNASSRIYVTYSSASLSLTNAQVASGDGISICYQNASALEQLCQESFENCLFDIENDGYFCNRDARAARNLSMIMDICKTSNLHIFTHIQHDAASTASPMLGGISIVIKSPSNFPDDSITFDDDDIDSTYPPKIQYLDDRFTAVRVLGARTRYGDITKDIDIFRGADTTPNQDTLIYQDTGIVSTSDAQRTGDALNAWYSTESLSLEVKLKDTENARIVQPGDQVTVTWNSISYKTFIHWKYVHWHINQPIEIHIKIGRGEMT